MDSFYIVDPVCANEYGHNLFLMKKFKDFLEREYDISNTILVSSRYLPEQIDVEVDNFFDFYYGECIKLDHYSDQLDRYLNKASWFPKVECKTTMENEFKKLKIAQTDAELFLEKYKINSSDVVFWPGADFYGLHGMLETLINREPSEIPMLLIRFIGVMENVSAIYADPKFELFGLIKKLNKVCDSVRLSAETPRYADYIARHTGMQVVATPHPIIQTKHGKSKDKTFVVSSPGSGRIDKGFDRLLSIVKKVNESIDQSKISFIFQAPPCDVELSIQKNVSQLYAMHNVTLLPSKISADEINHLYLSSNVVLLPYDPNIYKMRGSASFVEAVEYNNKVLASKGCSFETQLNYYNAGAICGDESDFAKFIIQYFYRDDANLYNETYQTLFRLMIDMKTAYGVFFQ